MFWAPGIMSGFLMSIQMLRERERESGVSKATGSYRTYLSLVKLQTLVPESAAEDLPLGRTVTLVPEFSVKYLHWAKNW